MEKRQDADVAYDFSDSVVTCPSDKVAVMPVTHDDTIGIGISCSTRPIQEAQALL